MTPTPADMTGGDGLIRVENVRKSFHGNPVLRDISLTVGAGEVVVIAGRSGSGKSTLLRCMNNLETIDAGRIYADGELIGYREVAGRLIPLKEAEVARQRRDLGMVFQQFNLFPHLTVLDNITAAPIHVRGEARAGAVAYARELLQRVGLPEKESAYPRQLSGGQQQRVAIARALAMRPKALLFDEPTSALDPEMIREVLNVMTDLSENGMTMIVVTHELGFARAAADRIVLMHEGEIVENATPDLFFNAPKSEAARQFLSKVLP
ncbi:amino acid ABC transporter ATP-binding protein [Kaistia algarum]|uniref:amino acid ABC transporter ATP-binding protein n=1 Tax=Kaistia algarum TaxID=2083279 RepID=UPI0026B9BAC8|nr:amino acid ABC transporter ATP-binding protein [Kaistia algarum]